jgi:hypothetical protein
MTTPGQSKAINNLITANSLNQTAEPAKQICAGLEVGFWYQVEVLSFVRKTQATSDYYCKETEVGQWIGQPLDFTKNQLLNYLSGTHLYVLVVYRGQVYLCDGLNHSLMAAGMRADLARRLGVSEVKTMRYDSQISDTHCTNSSVLIMIELLKLFKRGVEQLPQVISVPRYMREKLVNRIHKKEYRRPSIGTRPGTRD